MKSDGFAAAALAEFWLGADIVNQARLNAVQLPAQALHEPTKGRQVLDCGSPLALFDLVRGRKSGSGLPQSKTLSRRRTPLARAIGVTGNVCKVFAKNRERLPFDCVNVES